MDIQTKILSKSQDLFLQYGVKRITMEEISKELGISKKTLYQYVENKADLINQVIANYIQKEQAEFKAIQAAAKDAIDEMLKIGQFVNQTLQQINPAAIYDLQKYYHDSWELIQALELEFTLNIIKENIKTGIQQGLYRQGLDVDIIAKFYVGKADVILDRTLFPLKDYTRSDLHRSLMEYHLYGIASVKGIELLRKYQTT